MPRLAMLAAAAAALLLAGCGGPSPVAQPAQPAASHPVEFVFTEARAGDEAVVSVDDTVLFRGSLREADAATGFSGSFKRDLAQGSRKIVWRYRGSDIKAWVEVKPSTRFIYLHAVAPVQIEASDFPDLD